MINDALLPPFIDKIMEVMKQPDPRTKFNLSQNGLGNTSKKIFLGWPGHLGLDPIPSHH